MKDFSSHFRALIERQIPDDPRILMPRGGRDMMILVTWRLTNDALRVNKRSRMVRIVISEDALQHYSRGDDELRQASDNRLISWFKLQMSRFDPTHDAPLGVEPPSVTWTIGTLELNES